MIRLIRAEFLKLRSTQVWFWLLLASMALTAIGVIAGLAPRTGVQNIHDVAGMLGTATTADIAVFVLGVLAVTTEFRYQTITPTVLQTPSRWAIVTAKMITYAITGAVFALFALLAEAAVGMPWLSSKGIPVHLSDGHVQHAIFGTFGVIALFGIVGLGVGALLRNQIVAVVVGIVFLVVLENVLLAIPGVKHAWPYTPEGGTQAILYTQGDNSPVDGVHLLSTGAGVVVLLLWAFIPAIIGAAVTMNRDIT